MNAERAKVASARRWVVKIGSSSLAKSASELGGQSPHERLALAIKKLHHARKSVVIVTSGAIALGTKKLGFVGRPKQMAKLQAAASAGQSLLMHAYESAFESVGLAVAQVLLTHADLSDRVRANNARAAISALLEAGAVPILNENDAVAVEEIKFGDNDQLSAMVAPLVGADVLVLLSDIDGLIDQRGQRVPTIYDVTKEAVPLVRREPSNNSVGTGGMTSKLEAARRATLGGCHVVIANASRDNVLGRISTGEDEGTLFLASSKKLPAKKHWIAFTLRPRGEIWLDSGAARAVKTKGTSVLSVGVVGVRGDFQQGDSVRLLGPDGTELGRGLARCPSTRAVIIAGTSESASADESVIVHRSDLVVW